MPRPFFYHSRYDGVSAYERADEVYVYDLPEIFRAHFRHRDALYYSCVVDEYVYRAEVFFNVRDERAYRLFVRNVRDVPARLYVLGAVGFHGRVEVFTAPAVEGYASAGLRERRRHCEAYPVCAAGYQRRTSFKRKHVVLHHARSFPRLYILRRALPKRGAVPSTIALRRFFAFFHYGVFDVPAE